MIRSKQYALMLTTLAVVAAVALPARRAAAQDQAAIDKLVQMNKRALEDYDTLEWDSAKRTLLDALMAGKKAGLDNHPVMARTYVHLGAVYITGFKNREKAIQSFVRALEIDPSIQLTKGIASAEVNDAFAEAQRKAGGGGGGASAGGGDENRPPPTKRRRGPVMDDEGGGAPPPSGGRRRRPSSSDDEESGEPDLPIKIAALDCPEPDEAILEKSVTLRCAVSPRLPVASVVLHYRAPGKEEYEEVEMKKTPKGWYQGKIPKKAVVGKSLQFWFEGRNSDGKAVVANGDPNAPNIMLIVEQAGAAKEAGEGEGEEENPLDEDGRPKKPKIYLGHRDTSNEGLDIRFGKRKFWIGLGFGSGYGYIKGNGLEAVNQSTDIGNGCNSSMPGFHCLQSAFQPGLAWAGWFQVEPEFGYALTPNLAIALTGRLQYIVQPSKYAHYAATGAISGLLKLIYYTQQSMIRGFGTVMVGGGEGARFVVYPGQGTGLPYSDFQDTVRAGPALVGLGGGVYFELSRAVSLVLEADVLAGLPQFGAWLDGVLALQVNFYGSGPTHSSLTDKE
jgi:hypothetical protein